MRLNGSAAVFVCGWLLQLTTLTHGALTLVTLGPSYQVGLGSYSDIDVNSDGINDLRFGTPGTFGSSFATYVTPLNGAEILFDPNFGPVSNLSNWIGEFDTLVIDSNPRLIPASEFLAIVHYRWIGGNIMPNLAFGDGIGGNGGPFLNQNHGYLGYSFLTVDGRHYGWFDIGSVFTNSVLLNSYAFESTPNTPVYLYGSGVPEPGRGVLMLCGGVWLVLRRRRAVLGAG